MTLAIHGGKCTLGCLCEIPAGWVPPVSQPEHVSPFRGCLPLNHNCIYTQVVPCLVAFPNDPDEWCLLCATEAGVA
jgi:hypothetical protein